jgi:hypothetical protein
MFMKYLYQVTEFWHYIAQSVHRLGYGLDDRVSIPGKSNDETFSLRHRVHTGSGDHPTSYLMGTGGFFLRVKH